MHWVTLWTLVVGQVTKSTNLSSNYTMACLPVRGDNSRAFANGLSYIQGGQTWFNYFIPSTSV